MARFNTVEDFSEFAIPGVSTDKPGALAVRAKNTGGSLVAASKRGSRKAFQKGLQKAAMGKLGKQVLAGTALSAAGVGAIGLAGKVGEKRAKRKAYNKSLVGRASNAYKRRITR